MSVVPLARGHVKPPGPRTPYVTELLRKAIEWRQRLDSGEVPNKAEIARREGTTRARVTQVMPLLRLAPETRDRMLAMPETISRPKISKRRLRPVTKKIEQTRQ